MSDNQEINEVEVSNDNNITLSNVGLSIMCQVSKELKSDIVKHIYSRIEDEPDKTVVLDNIVDELDCTRETVNKKINKSSILERIENRGPYTGQSLIRLKGDSIIERAVLLALACNRRNETQGIPDKIVIKE
jgi:hypothetical protein